MKKKIIVLLVLMFSLSVIADYSIDWSTLDGGGGTSTGGNYSLTGTIGQHDADTVASGGDYVVSGGFWPGTYGCIVNLTDLSNFMFYWLDSGASIPADLDGDGKVDNVDFSDLAYYWQDYCPDGWQLK
jgi:hypothetical protein